MYECRNALCFHLNFHDIFPCRHSAQSGGETLPLRTAVQMFWLPGIAAVGLTALAWLVSSFLVYLLAIIMGSRHVARLPSRPRTRGFSNRPDRTLIP